MIEEDKNKDKKEETKPVELSQEDQELKDQVEFWINNIINKDKIDQLKYSLELKEKIIEAVKETNSLPKPVKFVKPFYKELIDKLDNFDYEVRNELSSILSFCSISLSEDYNNDALKLFLKTQKLDLFKFGDDYINSIAGDLGEFYQNEENNKEELKNLSFEITKYYMSHHLEINALDLLLDMDLLELVNEFITEDNIKRILEYLLETSKLSADQHEFLKILNISFDLSIKFNLKFKALIIAIKLNNFDKIKKVFDNTTNLLQKKQLSFLLARHRICLFEDDEKLFNIIGNERLSEFYLNFVENLDALKPKTCEEVYKSKIDNPNQKIDSALINMADAFVNAFVNLGTGRDSLMNNNEKPYINEVKEMGQMCTAASIGLIHLWDFDTCSNNITDYLDLKDGFTKAGALIGLGLSNSGIWNENDQALAIINDNLESSDKNTLVGAIYGLGLAYAGTAREDLLEILSPFVMDQNQPLMVSGTAALSLGLIFVSQCNEEICNIILSSLMSFDEKILESSYARYFGIGLALNFLGKQESSEAVIETLKTIEFPIARYTEIIVELASFVGTGNVLIIQRMMRFLAEETTKDNSPLQTAVLSCLPFICIGEKTGQEMCLRIFHHVMQYCDKEVKRGLPILLSFLSISNPKITFCDLLLKLSYEEDEETSKRALLGFGIIGFGTNNSRIAGYLRNLAIYYEKDLQHLYCIKISQGMIHAGKGTVTLDPFYCDRFLYSKVGMAGLFTFSQTMLDTQNLLIEKFNYLIYLLTLSIYPKMMFLLDEKLEAINTSIRVGQSIDTVTQVGDPRKITGFQTFTTPVVIGYNERSEFVNDEYLPVLEDSILENFVIVKKNPDYKKEEVKKKTSYFN